MARDWCPAIQPSQSLLCRLTPYSPIFVTSTVRTPRDRIYGLLGLADDKNAPELYVDYEESVHDLSLRVSKYLIANGAQCSVLYALHPMQPGIPSWAISLEDVKEPQDFVNSGNVVSRAIYHAAGSTKFQSEISSALDPRLTTRGVILGSVTSTILAAPASAGYSAENFTAHMTITRPKVPRWMHRTATWLGLDVSEFRLKCFKTLLGDLEYRDNSIQRAGNDASSIAFRRTLDYWYPPATTLREFVTYMRSINFIQEHRMAVQSAQLLMRVLPGRRLEILLSTPFSTWRQRSHATLLHCVGMPASWSIRT